jgi:hypothetical protein
MYVYLSSPCPHTALTTVTFSTALLQAGESMLLKSSLYKIMSKFNPATGLIWRAMGSVLFFEYSIIPGSHNYVTYKLKYPFSAQDIADFLLITTT